MRKAKKDKIKHIKAMQKKQRKNNQLLRESQDSNTEKKMNLGMREYALSELSKIIIRFRNENPRDFVDDIVEVAKEMMDFAIRPERKFKEFLKKNDLYKEPRNNSTLNTTERMIIKLEMSAIPYLFRQTQGNISEEQYGSIKVNFEFVHMILVKGLEEKIIDVLKEYVDYEENLVTIEAVYKQGRGKYDINKKIAQPNIQWVTTHITSSLDSLYYRSFIYGENTYLEKESQVVNNSSCDKSEQEKIDIGIPALDLRNTNGYVGEKSFFIEFLKSQIKKFESFIFKDRYELDITEAEVNSLVSYCTKYLELFAKNDDYYRSNLILSLMKIHYVNDELLKLLLDNWDKDFINKEYYILNPVERAFIITITDTINYYNDNLIEVCTYLPLVFNYLLMIYYSIIDGMKEYHIIRRTCVVDKNDIPLACEYVYNMNKKVSVISDIEDLADTLFRTPWNERVDYKQMYKGIEQEVKETKNILEKFNFVDNCHYEYDVDELFDIRSMVTVNNGLISFNAKEINMKLLNEELNNLNYVQILEKGIQFKRFGRFNEAKECYIRAIKIEPRQANAYYNLGKILYILNEFEASVRAYTMAYKNNICDIIRETYVSVDKFYINLGHSLLDQNAKQEDYSIINEYRILLNPLLGTIVDVNVNRDNKKKHIYEKKYIAAAKEYLDGK